MTIAREFRSNETNERKRKGWKAEIIRPFEEASGDLKCLTEQDILADIKLSDAAQESTRDHRSSPTPGFLFHLDQERIIRPKSDFAVCEVMPLDRVIIEHSLIIRGDYDMASSNEKMN